MVREANKAYSIIYPMDLSSTPLSWYKGMAYFNSGLINDAIREYEMALRINPNQLRLLNDIASAYEHNDQLSQAVFYYRKAIAISPFFIEANLNLSATYFNSNNIDSSFYYIDKIYSIPIDKSSIENYAKHLDIILYEKAFSILKSTNDSLLTYKLMPVIENKDSLRTIYDLSKSENQPFAKYLINYGFRK